MTISCGRLLGPDATPPHGEHFETLATVRNVVVEQILSSADDNPETYVQTQDEWVVLLAGSASLDVGGEPIDLDAGDWVVLPAGVPHRVTRTAAGTQWLAVHVHATPPTT
jgi:cupin 2 domain-containing protein